MAEPSPTNPPPLQCLSCWYTIGTHDAAACPECGEPVTEVTRRLFYRRAELSLQAHPGVRRSTVTILAGIALYVALIAFSAPNGWYAFTGFLATFALALLGWAAPFAITLWLGASNRTTDPRPERKLIHLLWDRHVVLLHAPWLIPPAMAVVFLIVGAFLRIVAGSAQGAEAIVAFLFFILWLAMCIVAITEWLERWGQDVDAACLRSTRVPRNAAAVSFVLFFVNLIAGFAGAIAMLAAAWQMLQTALPR